VEFFFYGTLMDTDVLAAVICRRVAPARLRPAVIKGFRRVYRHNAVYPVLIPATGGVVDGVVVAGIGRVEAQRLVTFEGSGYGLDRRTVAVGDEQVAAFVFLPRPDVQATDEEWSFEQWLLREKPAYIRRVRALDLGRV